MALYDQLPVYKISYELLSLLLDICPKMQRSMRYTLGEHIQHAAVELLQNIYRANCSHEKTSHLAQARDNLVSVRLFIRLTHDKHQISSKDFLRANDLIENAGKQLTASEHYSRDCYILKLDIRGYFMNIDKRILLEKIDGLLYAGPATGNMSTDRETVDYLIRETVMNDPRADCIFKGRKSDRQGLPPSKSLFHSPEHCGLPIGNLTSQLFSNVYLHGFDRFMKETLGLQYYGRYVDDFVIVHTDRHYLKQVIRQTKDFLKNELHLELHPHKVYLQHYTKGVKFPGATVKAAVRSSINSYLGLMKHFCSYSLLRSVVIKPVRQLQLYRYGYFRKKDNGWVYKLTRCP
jgi:hypothetical protein